MTSVKAVFCVSSKLGPKMSIFGGKMGVNVKFWFCDSRKAHPCAEPRLLTYFASMPWWCLGCIWEEEPKK